MLLVLVQKRAAAALFGRRRHLDHLALQLAGFFEVAGVGVRGGQRFDVATSAVIFTAYAVPGFLFAILLIVVFAGGSYFDWFPLRGLTSENFDDLTWFGKVRDYFLCQPGDAPVRGMR